MASILSLSLLALSARLVFAQDDQTCFSYGIDFQNGGSYFQNSLSSDDFSFVSQYSGCQNDTAYNILVDPNGDQTLCSDTNLQPDDTNMLSTCPIEKNQLFSGPWSIVILSDNGDDPSIAYERDFSLSVGPQSTSTYTPTVTATSVIVPVVTATQTVTDTSITVLNPSTITKPSTTVTPTVFVTPKRVTTTTQKALFTIVNTKYTVDVTKTTVTKTATCTTPTRQAHPDPSNKIVPTVGPMRSSRSAKFMKRAEEAKARFVEERRVRMEIYGRAPDPQPLVVTDTVTSHWPTVTSTSTGPATTATITSTTLTTSTSTPPAITVLQGKTTAKAVTSTLATPTRVVTIYNIATSVTTKTLHYVYTIKAYTTPPAVSQACKTAGGILGNW